MTRSRRSFVLCLKVNGWLAGGITREAIIRILSSVGVLSRYALFVQAGSGLLSPVGYQKLSICYSL